MVTKIVTGACRFWSLPAGPRARASTPKPQPPPCAVGAPPTSGGAPPTSGGAPPCSDRALPASGGPLPCSDRAPPCSDRAPPTSGGAPPCSDRAPPASGGAPPCLTERPPPPGDGPLRAALASNFGRRGSRRAALAPQLRGMAPLRPALASNFGGMVHFDLPSPQISEGWSTSTCPRLKFRGDGSPLTCPRSTAPWDGSPSSCPRSRCLRFCFSPLFRLTAGAAVIPNVQAIRRESHGLRRLQDPCGYLIDAAAGAGLENCNASSSMAPNLRLMMSSA